MYRCNNVVSKIAAVTFLLLTLSASASAIELHISGCAGMGLTAFPGPGEGEAWTASELISDNGGNTARFTAKKKSGPDVYLTPESGITLAEADIDQKLSAVEGIWNGLIESPLPADLSTAVKSAYMRQSLSGTFQISGSFINTVGRTKNSVFSVGQINKNSDGIEQRVRIIGLWAVRLDRCIMFGKYFASGGGPVSPNSGDVELDLRDLFSKMSP